jgi:hypothetical protein
MNLVFRTTTAAVLLSATGLAQQDPAEALFNKGVDAMEAGKLDEACPAIAESQRLDPRIGTLFTLAECESRRDKNAAALGYYREFLRQYEALPEAQKTRQAARKKIADEALPRLAGKVGQLSVEGVPAGAELLLDGKKLDPASLQGIPVEPGEHKLLVRQGSLERTTALSLQAGETRTVTPALPEPPPQPPPGAPPPHDPPPKRPSALPFYVAAGVGAAGLVVGTVGGVLALSSKGTADKECVNLVCSRQGMDAVESGRFRANLSTVGVSVGLLGAGAALGLWLSGVSAPARAGSLRVAPVIAANQAGGLLEGAW